MWMEVGVWPPPARARWSSPHRDQAEQVERSRWVSVAAMGAASACGMTFGSVVTLMMLGLVCA